MSNLELFKSFAPTISNDRNQTNNAVIYTRVSHHSQEDNTSLESQKKYCEAFAKRRGLNIVDYFGGTYESAKTDDRKEFNRMLSFVKRSKHIAYIIVYSYERFSRSGINGASIADDLLKKYGVVTLAVTQELDPTTPAGSFQQNILFLFGQMDNELRRDKTVTGMRELLSKGYYLHAIPRGYTNLNKGSKAVNQKIVINEEGQILRKAFHWKADKNLANAEICRKLAKLGLEVDERRLAEVFRNPFYAGIIVSKMLPGKVIEGKHEPMVESGLFLKINDIIAEKRFHPITHKDNDINLPLKRFMKCCECDTPMTGFLVKKKGLYYYKCRTKGCKTSKSAKSLHEGFTKILAAIQVEEKHIEGIELGLLTVYECVFSAKKEELKLLKTKLLEIERNLEQIEERYAIGKINDQIYEKYCSKYQKERKEILTEIDRCNVKSSNFKKIVDFMFKVCRKPLNLWKSNNLGSRLGLQYFTFPNGIFYNKQKGRVQTSNMNALFAITPQIKRLLKGIKKGDPTIFDRISALVTPNGQVSNFLNDDIQLLLT